MLKTEVNATKIEQLREEFECAFNKKCLHAVHL